jgi:hypothetical protein
MSIHNQLWLHSNQFLNIRLDLFRPMRSSYQIEFVKRVNAIIKVNKSISQESFSDVNYISLLSISEYLFNNYKLSIFVRIINSINFSKHDKFLDIINIFVIIDHP